MVRRRSFSHAGILTYAGFYRIPENTSAGKINKYFKEDREHR